MPASQIAKQVLRHAPQILGATPKFISRIPVKSGSNSFHSLSHNKPKLPTNFLPTATQSHTPTSNGINAAASRLHNLRSMSSSANGFNRLRAGDYNDDGYNSTDPSNPDYYNNQMNGINNGYQQQQEIQIKPLSADQEKFVNHQNGLKVKHLVTDIFSNGHPNDPSKEAKILELAPFLNPDARTKLGNIANNEPILGHGNKTWSKLEPHEKQGVINDIKSGQMTHSEALLQQQTQASVEDQRTAFFANRLMSANNMMATFMTELAQLNKKYTEMLRNSV